MNLANLYVLRVDDQPISLEPQYITCGFEPGSLDKAEVYNEPYKLQNAKSCKWETVREALAARDEWHEGIQKDAVISAYSMPDTERM